MAERPPSQSNGSFVDKPLYDTGSSSVMLSLDQSSQIQPEADDRSRALRPWNSGGAEPVAEDYILGTSLRNDRITASRLEAERRFPLIKQFRDKVNIAPTIAGVRNKGGMGEYVEAGGSDNPMPGKPTITFGPNFGKLRGGLADIIIADMVHAAHDLSPEFKELKREMVSNFSEGELSLASRRYDKDYKGRSGSNFATFDNFLNTFWSDMIVQHLLLPENSEIAKIMRTSPNAVPALNAIKQLFETGGELLNE